MLLLFLALGLIWMAATAGFLFARSSKATAQKVEQHIQQIDLSQLNAEQRMASLQKLTDEVNSLPADERRKYRQDGQWKNFFNQLNDAEKSVFIERTLPTGFQHMLTSFEQLPADQRQRMLNETLKHLQEGSGAPVLSPELQKQVVDTGLKSYYANSSAQAKAELAPVFEQMQQMMDKGTLFRPAN